MGGGLEGRGMKLGQIEGWRQRRRWRQGRLEGRELREGYLKGPGEERLEG